MSLQKESTPQELAVVRQAAQNNEVEIDLVELFYRLLENLKFIIPAAIIGAVIAGIYTTKFITPKYTATSKLYVVNTSSAVVDLSSLQIGTQLASDYVEVFSNWHLHERVLQELNLPYSYKEMNGMVKVTNSNTQRILYINVTSTSPDEAKLLADTYANVAQEFIAEVMSTQRPNLFEEALKPTAPSSPNKTRNVIIGFILGGMIVAGIVTLQFILDDKIRSEDDVAKYIGLPVLGVMTSQRTGKKREKSRRGGNRSGKANKPRDAEEKKTE